VRLASLTLLVTFLVPLLSACGQEVTGAVGSAVASGDYQLTVTGIENPAQPPDRFTNPKPGNRFVKADVTVENVGQQHLPVAAGSFVLRDSGGIDNAAQPGIPSDRGLRQASIGPGQRWQGPLYFEMAANLQPRQLVFAPSVVGWRTKIIVETPA